MPSLDPFKPFLFYSYFGNNKNPPITDEICWSLDIQYCGASLYFKCPASSAVTVRFEHDFETWQGILFNYYSGRGYNDHGDIMSGIFYNNKTSFSPDTRAAPAGQKGGKRR